MGSRGDETMQTHPSQTEVMKCSSNVSTTESAKCVEAMKPSTRLAQAFTSEPTGQPVQSIPSDLETAARVSAAR